MTLTLTLNSTLCHFHIWNCSHLSNKQANIRSEPHVTHDWLKHCMLIVKILEKSKKYKKTCMISLSKMLTLVFLLSLFYMHTLLFQNCNTICKVLCLSFYLLWASSFIANQWRYDFYWLHNILFSIYVDLSNLFCHSWSPRWC